jgi:hypothetical protein
LQEIRRCRTPLIIVKAFTNERVMWLRRAVADEYHLTGRWTISRILALALLELFVV